MEGIEIVGIGHPDKMADIIADTLVNEWIDIFGKNVKTAFEVMVTKEYIVIGGEAPEPTKEQLKEISDRIIYLMKDKFQYDEKMTVKFIMKTQSPELNIPAEKMEIKDNSIIFGFCNKRETGMPYTGEEARFIAQRLNGGYLKNKITPDGKILLMGREKTNTHGGLSLHMPKKEDFEKFKTDLPAITERTNLKITTFKIGGLNADTGMTNRKLQEHYGPNSRSYGGLAGKDLSKIDRLGAYFARGIAKHIVEVLGCNYANVTIYCRPGERFFDEGAQVIIQTGGSMRMKALGERSIKDIVCETFDFTFQEMYDRFNIDGLDFAFMAEHGNFGDTYAAYKLPGEKLDEQILQKLRSNLKPRT